MPKRRRDKELERKIKRYKRRLERWREENKDDSESESASEQDRTAAAAAATAATSATPPTEELQERPILIEEESQEIKDTSALAQERETEEETLDEEILTLLGEAPVLNNYGPGIHKEIASRWQQVIKNGLSKENRVELKSKYLTPENCKILEAPKLNLEALAAINDLSVKRDKALANKQAQMTCALTALGRAFGKLIKNKENLEVINFVSDAARLLCDLQHQESITRRNFVLQGLDQSIRDSIKDAETDQWLFGEAFAEKLKASKAIKKSGQEISGSKTKKPQHQQLQQRKPPLNSRGPVAYQPRGFPQQTGPRYTYRKPMPRAQPPVQPQRYTQTKPTPRATNSRN